MPKFNRAAEDIGNVIAMEHVNVTVPDQVLATQFYVSGLGFTRDPYIDFGPYNVWVNVGEQQFHMPTNEPQVLRGRIGVIVPSLAETARRLTRLASRLEGTRFSMKEARNHLDVTCPWGNRIRCHEAKEHGMQLGIPYVEFEVPKGTSERIARFYETILDVPTRTAAKNCTIEIGRNQTLVFREVAKPEPHYDGHHIAIYVADFSGPHGRLIERGLISEESDQHQYRFQDLTDLATGEVLFQIEHEVRSLHHPMWNRNLVNRNANQSFFTYRQGRDAFVP